MTEHEKVERARKQLILVGVICVAVVVFALWIMTLPRTLERNRAKFAPATSTIQQLKELWKK